MDDHEWLAVQFEQARPHLSTVAYRMLGSPGEAEDAVQEAWIRLSRSDPSGVDNLRGWLTTVVARICLDMLRSRKARPEQHVGVTVPDEVAGRDDAAADPEQEVLLAEAVGPALLVVLERLTPAERVAFVLHDMFGVSFEEIAPIVGRTPTAARQLGSRARRRVQGTAPEPGADRARQRAIVEAFLAASRGGDFQALVELLDPDVVLRADAAVVAMGGPDVVRGARAVAETFSGQARVAQPALVDGGPALVWVVDGRPKVVFALDIPGETIAGIRMVAEPEHLDRLDVELLDAPA